MDLSQLTTKDLKAISRLLEEKEALLSKVSAIDSQLSAFSGGAPVAATTTTAPAKRATRKTSTKRAPASKGRGRRGALKEAMVKALKNAGADGISVKELASKLNQKPANIHAWFHSTGKKMSEVQKVGTATYGWVE